MSFTVGLPARISSSVGVFHADFRQFRRMLIFVLIRSRPNIVSQALTRGAEIAVPQVEALPPTTFLRLSLNCEAAGGEI